MKKIVLSTIPNVTKVTGPRHLKHRNWINIVHNHGQEQASHYKFKIMSFNMLNQLYMWPEVYDSYVEPQYQIWDYRVKLLTNIVKDEVFRSDIMCFQEMEARVYYKFWDPFFKNMNFGSEFIRKSRPAYWKEEDDKIDGVSIFFDKSKFELIESKKFQISNYFNKEFENSYRLKLNKEQINKVFNSRNQVCLIVALRHKLTNEIFVIANTHLYWKLNDVKFLQLLVVLEALSKFIKKFPNAKLLFSGDFNSTPASSVYRLLKNEEISTKNPDISKYLVDADADAGVIRPPNNISTNVFDAIISEEGLFTCYTKHLFGIFDYIWYNKEQFQLLRFLSGVDLDYLKDIQGLPNKDFPSDHIPLVAEFAITPKANLRPHI